MARIEPLNPPYSAETDTMLKKWMPPGSDREPLKLFRTLAVNPELSERMRPLGAYILGRHSQIEPREREIVIDRTCAVCGCEYEWGVHVAAFGELLGITSEKLAATATAKPDDAVWNEREALLVQMVDELHATAQISPDLWAKMILHWNNQQMLELMVMVGWYHIISFVANGTQIELEAWAERFRKEN
jgi:4-carboxymuconolactone decarboxylase